MRKTVLTGLGLVTVLALPASAAGTAGPFAGKIRQGMTRTHLYDNNPANTDCIQLAATYTVGLSYAPTGDTLTLSVGTKTATGSNGGAAVTVEAGVCASFAIQVTGTSVADTAVYAVTVTRQLIQPISVG